MAENTIQDRVGGRVQIAHCRDEDQIDPGLVERSRSEGVVDEQKLVWRVAHEVDDNTRNEHLDHAFSLLDSFRHSLSLHPVLVDDDLLAVQLVRPGKQMLTDDHVTAHLDQQRHHVEQGELNILEGHQIMQTAPCPREPEHAEDHLGAGVGLQHLVVEEDGQAEHQHRGPDEADHHQHAFTTAEDVRLDGVHNGDVAAMERNTNQ